jgi:hypothetical protein
LKKISVASPIVEIDGDEMTRAGPGAAGTGCLSQLPSLHES